MIIYKELIGHFCRAFIKIVCHSTMSNCNSNVPAYLADKEEVYMQIAYIRNI